MGKKKEKEQDAAATAPEGKKQGRKKMSFLKRQLLLTFALLVMVLARSTAFILLFGMLPTLVAVLIDRTRARTRALTVGAMNLAGCSPFILQLWTTDSSFENGVRIITDPRTVIIIYCAAGVGYLLDWAIVGIVSTVMVQRSAARISQIAKYQAAMVERWGREVTGEIPIDIHGFPLGDEHKSADPVRKTR